MNTLYLVRTILECVDQKLLCGQTEVKVCNLEPSAGTVVLVLSIITSAAGLGYKAARTLCTYLMRHVLVSTNLKHPLTRHCECKLHRESPAVLFEATAPHSHLSWYMMHDSA